MRLRLLPTALAATALLAGCGRRSGIGFDQFVNTTVELRKLSTRAPTVAGFAADKRQLEARLHVTDADLERWSRDHANDPAVMSAAWDSIEARLGRAVAADSASRHGGPGAPGTPAGLPPHAIIPPASAPAPAVGRSDAGGAPVPVTATPARR